MDTVGMTQVFFIKQKAHIFRRSVHPSSIVRLGTPFLHLHSCWWPNLRIELIDRLHDLEKVFALGVDDAFFGDTALCDTRADHAGDFLAVLVDPHDRRLRQMSKLTVVERDRDLETLVFDLRNGPRDLPQKD